VKPAVPAEAPVDAAPRPRTMMFRKRSYAPRPSPEQMQRQSDVLQSAWRHFGESAAVIAFLNTRHDRLEGQPLHLAVESAEGLLRVERLLEEMTLRGLAPQGE
jgi:hypothetical protein